MRALAACLTTALLCACSVDTPAGKAAAPPAAATAVSTSQLYLTLGGRRWQADREFFGAWHPPGYDRAVLMAGSFGPNDKNEQAFNLSLFGVAGPGRYTASGDTRSLKGVSSSAIQLANFSPDHYLIGGPFGYAVEVELLQAGPAIIEARFHGRMTASDGSELPLTDGYFLWRE